MTRMGMNRVGLAVVVLSWMIPGDAAVTAAPASRFDLQGFIAERIKAGERRIVVPPGRYRVTPRHGTHLLLKDLADTVIVADGVEMICTQTCRALVFENCRNVCFRGMTVDFDPLPFTEGRIVALAPDKRWVEFEIIEGYPEHQLQERIEIYDAATGRLRRETAGWSNKIEVPEQPPLPCRQARVVPFPEGLGHRGGRRHPGHESQFPQRGGRSRRHGDAVLRLEAGGHHAVCFHLLRFPGARVRRQYLLAVQS